MTDHRAFNAAVRRRDEQRVIELAEAIVSAGVKGLAPKPPLEWDDIRQAARLGIVLALRRYTGEPDAFYRVATAAAHNHAIDLIRATAGRRGQKPAPTVSLSLPEAGEGSAVVRQLASHSPDPCDVVALRDAFRALHEAAPTRASYTLLSLMGYRAHEIAAAAGTTDQNAWQHCHHGRRTLAALLAA